MEYNPIQIGDTGQIAADKINSMFQELFSRLLFTWKEAAEEIRAIETYKDGDQIGLLLFNAIYQFNSSSTATDDGINYLKPSNLSSTDAGRWELKKMFADRDKIQNLDGTAHIKITDNYGETNRNFIITWNNWLMIYGQQNYIHGADGHRNSLGYLKLISQNTNAWHVLKNSDIRSDAILELINRSGSSLLFDSNGILKRLANHNGYLHFLKIDKLNKAIYLGHIPGQIYYRLNEPQNIFIVGIPNTGDSIQILDKKAGNVIIDGGFNNYGDGSNIGHIFLGFGFGNSNIGIGLDYNSQLPEEKLDIKETTRTQGRRLKLDIVINDITLNKTNHYLKIDASSNNIVVTLPDTSQGYWHGQNYRFWRIDNSTNSVQIKDYQGNTLYNLIANQKLNLIFDSNSNSWDNW